MVMRGSTTRARGLTTTMTMTIYLINELEIAAYAGDLPHCQLVSMEAQDTPGYVRPVDSTPLRPES